jgi:hypothetical protein
MFCPEICWGCARSSRSKWSSESGKRPSVIDGLNVFHRAQGLISDAYTLSGTDHLFQQRGKCELHADFVPGSAMMRTTGAERRPLLVSDIAVRADRRSVERERRPNMTAQVLQFVELSDADHKKTGRLGKLAKGDQI